MSGHLQSKAEPADAAEKVDKGLGGFRSIVVYCIVMP